MLCSINQENHDQADLFAHKKKTPYSFSNLFNLNKYYSKNTFDIINWKCS